MLPQISPSPLTSLKEPIGHPNWVYELKHDGFRGILYVDREQAWLISRNGNKFRRFDPLLKQVLRSLKKQRAILDGEIVVLDEKGRSNFYDLMVHRGEPRYYAFDLPWLNGIDLRSRAASGSQAEARPADPIERLSPAVCGAPGGRRTAIL
jgi:bifunctional non-homologous end joining protein LigD